MTVNSGMQSLLELGRPQIYWLCGGFSRNSSLNTDVGTSKPSQHISKLLLLSMFAIAARYAESKFSPPPEGKMWEAGYNYLIAAREILSKQFYFPCGFMPSSEVYNTDKVFHRSQASTCQALLLLGHREFGIGMYGTNKLCDNCMSTEML
jgi:hypothetical protein